MTAPPGPPHAVLPRLALALLALALLVQGGLTAVASITQGPISDEALFAYVGWSWLVKGDLPYRDAFENKTPGIFALYGLSHRLCGYDPRPTRLLALACSAGAALAVGAATSAVFGGSAALWASGVCLLLLLRASVAGTCALSEHFMALPGALAWLLALAALRRSGLWQPALAGLLMATAILFKQIMGIEALALAGILLFCGGNGRAWRTVVFILCLAAPLVATTLYMARLGILPQFLDATLLCLRQAGSQPASLGERLKGLYRLLDWLHEGGAVILAVALGGFIAAWRERSRPEVRLILAWAVAGSLGAFSSGWLFGHQFRQAIVALAPLGGWAIASLIAAPTTGAPSPGRITALALIALGLCIPPATEWRPVLDQLASPAAWRQQYEPIIAQVQASSRPPDRIWVYPRDESIYLLTDRLSVSRYFSDCFRNRPGVSEELKSTLLAHPPRVLILQRQRMSPGRPFEAFLLDFAASRYRQVREVPTQPFAATVYERLPDPTG